MSSQSTNSKCTKYSFKSMWSNKQSVVLNPCDKCKTKATRRESRKQHINNYQSPPQPDRQRSHRLHHEDPHWARLLLHYHRWRISAMLPSRWPTLALSRSTSFLAAKPSPSAMRNSQSSLPAILPQTSARWDPRDRLQLHHEVWAGH